MSGVADRPSPQDAPAGRVERPLYALDRAESSSPIEEGLRHVKENPASRDKLVDQVLRGLKVEAPEGANSYERASLALEELRKVLFRPPANEALSAQLSELLEKKPPKIMTGATIIHEGETSFYYHNIPQVETVNQLGDAVDRLHAEYTVVRQGELMRDSTLSEDVDRLRELLSRLPDRALLQQFVDQIASINKDNIDQHLQKIPGAYSSRLIIDNQLRGIDSGLMEEAERYRPSPSRRSLLGDMQRIFASGSFRYLECRSSEVVLPDGSPGIERADKPYRGMRTLEMRYPLRDTLAGPTAITYRPVNEEDRTHLPKFLGDMFAEGGIPSFRMVVDGSTRQVNVQNVLLREDGSLWGMRVMAGDETRTFTGEQLLAGMLGAAGDTGVFDITIRPMQQAR